jgi:hypothetical protein
MLGVVLEAGPAVAAVTNAAHALAQVQCVKFLHGYEITKKLSAKFVLEEQDTAEYKILLL